MHYCDHTYSVVRPSVRPSSVRRELFTFATSSLKPLNGIQRSLTWSKITTSSTKFVFVGPIGKNKMAAPASDWLKYFLLLLWNRWTELNEIWQEEAISERPLPSLCSSDRSEKQDSRPRPLIGDYLFDFSSETTEQNSTKLDRKKRSQCPLPS